MSNRSGSTSARPAGLKSAARGLVDKMPDPLAEMILRTNAKGKRLYQRLAYPKHPGAARIYETDLPEGFPARKVTVKLSVPPMPDRPAFDFSDHVVDAAGKATGTVLLVTMGGFAISHDLGATWKHISIKGYARQRVLHAKWIGRHEILIQAASLKQTAKKRAIHILVIDERNGRILAENELEASPWHSSRAVDIRDDVIMYAEYPFEEVGITASERAISRVWRSRDRGRNWEIVKTAPQIRHFHFLQARPGQRGQWWLTSGDKPEESRIWISPNDGDGWRNVSGSAHKRVTVGKASYPHTMFRLTDLVWLNGGAVWGTDDALSSIRGDVRGPRVFRARTKDIAAPKVVGRTQWAVRNIVDLGDYLLIATQGSNKEDATPEEKRPGVYLMPKKAVRGTNNLVHLFDVDVYSAIRTGFTYSRASRAAKDGTFFSYRAGTDAFPSGHRLLRWDVSFS